MSAYLDRVKAKAADPALHPAWRAFSAEHAATLERIDRRIVDDAEEAKQARLALAWCRAHGCPHLEDERHDV